MLLPGESRLLFDITTGSPQITVVETESFLLEGPAPRYLCAEAEAPFPPSELTPDPKPAEINRETSPITQALGWLPLFACFVC